MDNNQYWSGKNIAYSNKFPITTRYLYNDHAENATLDFQEEFILRLAVLLWRREGWGNSWRSFFALRV
ncbi:MAG TPA: hypothetical protein VKQ08_01775 [Cyclobacteriaceae bacterium]|nr:hypothetical protein [Cyclobacteriaceae bacterium]